ncbi:MAG TPA: hypothetical protein PKH77_13455 [Anaerolineae bacterium]|nr:hypothetical protein [Anaerolineae bacterium]
MAVTTYDIEAIINGTPLPIETPYPLDDRGEGFRWYMAQPSDWLYDMASSVREAAIAEASASPEIKLVEHLPPTSAWIERQLQSKETAERYIAELEAKVALTPEEGITLASYKSFVNNWIDPSDYNRAREIVAKRGRVAFETYLIPRLLVDEDGHILFDLNTEDGRRRWGWVGQDAKTELRTPLYQVLLLIETAKNYKAGRSSAPN